MYVCVIVPKGHNVHCNVGLWLHGSGSLRASPDGIVLQAPQLH